MKDVTNMGHFSILICLLLKENSCNLIIGLHVVDGDGLNTNIRHKLFEKEFLSRQDFFSLFQTEFNFFSVI